MRPFLLLLALSVPACAAEQRTITLPGPDGVTLQAELFLPDGPPRGPAVLGLHGCSGFRFRNGQVFPTYRAWAGEFTGRGQAVLLPDSFGSRGQGEQCTVRDSTIRPGRERRQDAIAAATWLAAQPFAPAGGVVAVGWSHGGSTVLATAAMPEGAPILGYVAFYPGCTFYNRYAGWRSTRPMLLLIGEADDWTPAAPCAALAARSGSNVTYHAYPGAAHSFDAPDMALTERSGLAYTVNNNGRARVGTDHAARRDALERVREFVAALPR